jgi:hypothetical protein
VCPEPSDSNPDGETEKPSTPPRPYPKPLLELFTLGDIEGGEHIHVEVHLTGTYGVEPMKVIAQYTGSKI